MRVVHVGHGVEGGNLSGGQQIDRRQAAHPAAHHVVELQVAGTQDDNERDRSTPGSRADGIHKFAGLSAGPVVEANQHHVDSAGIAHEHSGGVEQFLEDLLIGCEVEFAGES